MVTDKKCNTELIMSTAIEFNNISKQYRLGLVSTKTLSHDLNRWWTMNILHKEDPYLKIGSVNDRSQAADSEYVWALKDIDLTIYQGERMSDDVWEYLEEVRQRKGHIHGPSDVNLDTILVVE